MTIVPASFQLGPCTGPELLGLLEEATETF
jgi:hypothetical protein